MPKITLRAYNREISSLIDRGLTDEAVAHCQYILQSYPKHLDTYRLLGKAYLEAHRHKEAVDLFQRVLAVVPDDFVTHVGMSIIRGEENDLEAAIWHMERAFEVQPSNQAIQDELKHLYGKRDGQEPQKIRLTRGALCRMYARGNQNRQAIAEIKSILHETPDRPDLEVLLARMYYLSGMNNEAISLAQKILEKLPFSYDTNKLMVEILLGQGKTKEADFYQKKLIALDPYEESVVGSSLTVDQIPDDAIFIDKFYFDSETQGGESASAGDDAAPDWLVKDLAGMEDLGAQGFTKILDASVLPSDQSAEGPASSTQPVVTDAVDETLPDWLQEAEGTKPEKDEDIPDFLKSTGWATAGTITEETPPAQVIKVDDEPAADGEITPGEIPDWLQSMAPGEGGESSPEPVVSDEASFSDWLSGLDQKSDSTPSEQPGMPSQVAAFETEPEPETEEENPTEPAPVYTQVLELPPEDQEISPAELPDWLQEISPEVEEKVADESTGWQPDQVMDEGFPIAGGTSILSPEDVPDWLQDLPSAGETTTQPPQAAVSVPPVGESPASEDVVTMALSPEEKENMPEWLAEIQQAIPPEEPIDKVRTAVLPDDEREEVEQMPDWLHLLDGEEKPAAEAQAPSFEIPFAETPVPPVEVPPIETIQQVEIPEPVEVIPPVETPALEEVVPLMEEPVIETVPQVEEVETDLVEEMEELPAFEIPVEEEETQAVEAVEDKPTTSILPPNPEDAAEELPEWLKEIESTEGTSPVEMQAEATTDEFPDWLKGYSTPPAESPLPPAEPAPEPDATLEVPNWLDGMDIGGAPDTTEVTDMPDWLKDMQVSAETGEEISAVATTGELPEWLQDDETAQPAVVSEVESVSEPQDMEIMPEMQIEPGLDLVSESVAAEIPESVAETGIPEIPSGEETISSAEEQVDESILADASAAAAAAAIGIPLYAEHAANRGVTESLPRIDMEETAEETVAVSETDVAAETEAEVSAALEEIIVGEIQPVPTSEPEVETLAEAVSEQETIVEPEVVEEVSSIATQESAEEVTVVEPEFVEESVSMVEPEQVEEVPEPVMETFESVFEEQIAPVVVDGKDYETVYEQALQAIQSGEVEKALPALSSLVTAEQKLDEVIKIVDTTLKEYPTDFNLWVVLGDAYGRNGNLQNALDAYTKAEEYLQ